MIFVKLTSLLMALVCLVIFATSGNLIFLVAEFIFVGVMLTLKGIEESKKADKEPTHD